MKRMGFKIQGEFNLKGNASSGLKSVGSALRGVKNDGSQVSSVLGRTSNAMNNAGSSASRAGQNAQAGARGFTSFGQAAQRAGDMASRAAKRAGDAWRTSANTMKGARDAMSSVFSLPNALVAGGAGLATKSVIDAVGFKEQSLIGFTTMLKDSSLALNTYKWALKTASATPFETTDVIDATKSMLASRFTLREIPDLFRTIGDTSSGFGLGADGMKNMIRTFGQIRGAGRATTEDLNQLTDAGVTAFPMLEKAYGLKGIKFRKALEAGKIGGEDAIGIILKGMKEQFGGGMEAQSKSIFGLASTLKSRPFELFQSMDADKELKPVKNVLENLAALTDFENNPIAKKIKDRFVKFSSNLFSGVFGPLASSTDPTQIGTYMDKVFNKLDQAGAWLETNGPGIVTGFKEFFTGIGDTINGVRGAFEWISSMSGKAGGVLGALGIGQGGKDAQGNGGLNVARVGGGLLAGLVGAKFVNGLLGGIPGQLLGGLFGGKGGKGAGGLLGGLLGGGVQKVFVVNMGGGLGGLENAAENVLGKGKGAGGLFGRVFDGAKGLAGNVLGKLPAMRSGLLDMVAKIGLNGSLLGAKIGQNLASLGGTIAGKLGLAGAAFGGGWMVGTALNGVNTGGINNDTGGSRTFGYDVQEALRYAFMGGQKTDEDQNAYENRMFEKKMRTQTQLRKGKPYGLDLGGDQEVSRAALEALNASWSEQVGGFCSRFVRQVFGKALGSKTSALFGSSAIESEQLWKKAGLTRSLGEINKSGGLRPGDVLFQGKGSGGFGHIGVVTQDPKTGKMMVAENTDRYGKRNDHRALTPIEAFGEITSVGRYGAGGGIPSPSQAAANVVARNAARLAARAPQSNSGPSVAGSARGGLPPVVINFTGDIIVQGADSGTAGRVAQAIKQQTTAALEQGVLEAFERLAQGIAGNGGQA